MRDDVSWWLPFPAGSASVEVLPGSDSSHNKAQVNFFTTEAAQQRSVLLVCGSSRQKIKAGLEVEEKKCSYGSFLPFPLSLLPCPSLRSRPLRSS